MRISLPWDDHVYGTMGPRRSQAEEIPSDVLQEILMKLPTKDVARSCCVSRHWRRAVRDDLSFGRLHAASHAALSAEPEFLLLSDVQFELGRSVRTGVFSVSSGKSMCSLAISHRYGLANICNGLLCFVDERDARAPAVVCNPATGETLLLPEAPPLSTDDNNEHMFALGFSPPTNEYKLFRLSFLRYSDSSEEQRLDVGVYTLGDARGWRKDCFLSPSRPTTTRNYGTSAPVAIDGKLYVVTRGGNQFMGQEAAGVLVVDVPSETCRTYPLPEDLRTYPDGNPVVFELKGRLCLAAHRIGYGRRPTVLRFWVMAMENKDSDGPRWDLRYSFCVEVEHPFQVRKPWSAWFQDDTLYYARRDTLHKYDTRLSVSDDHGRLLQWNKQLQRRSSLQWGQMVHPGYRPTLLSPRIFELPPSQDDTLKDKKL